MRQQRLVLGLTGRRAQQEGRGSCAAGPSEAEAAPGALAQGLAGVPLSGGGGGRAAGNRLGMLLGRVRAGGPCVQESRGANWQADSGLGWQESQAREAAGCNWHESSGSEVREG